MSSIGNHIRKLRISHHMTQQDLADQLNVTNKTVSKWETNRNLPDIEMIGKIAKTFDISVDELITNKKALRLKTKRLLYVGFIEMILFILMLLFVSNKQSISMFNFVLSFALPNILIILISIITSYFISYDNQWLKVSKYIIYISILLYDMMFILSIFPLGLGIFVIFQPSLTLYLITVIMGIIIGV